jgi:hypothetical protein
MLHHHAKLEDGMLYFYTLSEKNGLNSVYLSAVKNISSFAKQENWFYFFDRRR